MAGRRGGVVVPVSTEFNSRGLVEAKRQLGAFGKSISKPLAGIGAALGGALAFSTISDQLQQMASAAAQDQKSMAALGQTMRNLGMNSQMSGVEDFIRGMMLATGVADDQLRPAMSRLLRSTNDTAESQRALQIALDISAATGKDLDTVANGLGKAYDGNAASLGRLGLGLDKALLKSGDMKKITAELTKKFGGQAATAAETYAGQLQRISTAAAEAQEAVGYALLGALNDVSAAFGGTGGAVEGITALGDATANIVTGIGDLTAAVASLGKQADATGTDWGDMAIRFAPNFMQPAVLALNRLGDAGEESRRKEAELNDEVEKAVTLRKAYSGQLNAAAVAQDRMADSARKSADAVKALQDALNKRGGPARNMIAANIRLREMRRNGPDAGADKKLSMDERKKFGLDYAGVVEDKYQLLVDAGKLKKAQSFLQNSRSYLGSQVSPGFAKAVLPNLPELQKAIAEKDAARAQRQSATGAKGWASTMSSVFGGNVTINIEAQTPAEAVQKAKEWARLAAAGRGPALPAADKTRPGSGLPNNGWGLIK